MTNRETDQVLAWLEREDVRPSVVTLTNEWNSRELLGIDLADQIQALVKERLEAVGMNVGELDGVEWSELAEHFAEVVCGVDEDELTRRRVEAGGSE